MNFKKVSLFALLPITVGGLLFTSCSKSNNNNSAGISATVGTSSFTGSTLTQAWLVTNGDYFNIGGLNISNKDSAILDINFAPPFVLNQKISSDTNYDVSIEYLPNGVMGTKDYYATNGQGTAYLTVTSYDSINHKIAGTFNGVLYNNGLNNDSIVVTNGKFNTSYTVQ